MTKADLHNLVDELPDNSIEVAADLLRRAAADPETAHLLLDPWDDEPLSREEIADHRAGLEAVERGEGGTGKRPSGGCSPPAELPLWRVVVVPCALKQPRRLSRHDRSRISSAPSTAFRMATSVP